MAPPLSWVERLPLVTASSGLSGVAAACAVTRRKSTSSSSAAIWLSVVRMPWPSSTLPGVMVTRPSAWKDSHCDRRRLRCRLPGSRGLPSAGGMAAPKPLGAVVRPVSGSGELRRGLPPGTA